MSTWKVLGVALLCALFPPFGLVAIVYLLVNRKGCK
jgi:hypothetical protein